MGKWKHRSEEEKKRIYEEQKAVRERKNTTGFFNNNDSKTYSELLAKGEIPLNCKDHGFVHAKKYIDYGIVSGIRFIGGKCINCERMAFKAIHSLQDMMIIPPLISKLKDKGRVTTKKPDIFEGIMIIDKLEGGAK